MEPLRTYAALSWEQRKAVLMEAAAIGEKGLAVNQPEVSYRLETLPGAFSGLQLAALIEIGARQVLGLTDGGFGFEAEVETAAVGVISPAGVALRPHSCELCITKSWTP